MRMVNGFGNCCYVDVRWFDLGFEVGVLLDRILFEVNAVVGFMSGVVSI